LGQTEARQDVKLDDLQDKDDFLNIQYYQQNFSDIDEEDLRSLGEKFKKSQQEHINDVPALRKTEDILSALI
jgi:hypothetical protein